MNSARENILGRIRTARLHRPDHRHLSLEPVDRDSPVVARPDLPLADLFRQELEAVNGQVIPCNDEREFLQKLKNVLAEKNCSQPFIADPEWAQKAQEAGIRCISEPGLIGEAEVAIAPCLHLVARFGSVLFSSENPGGRIIHASPSILMVLAKETQIIYDLKDFFSAGMNQSRQNALPSLVTLATGPSRTADIEKTLILGAHGPRELLVFILKK